MTITKEKSTDARTEDSIELSAAERYVIEAGSYLAYAPANSNLEPGRKVVAMTPDFKDENGYTAAKATDFTPDAQGLYVFRRIIGVNKDNQTENFEYVGYYYVPGMEGTTKEEPVLGTEAEGHEGEAKWVKHKIDQTTPEADTTVWTADPSTAPTAEDGYEFTLVTKTVTDDPEIGGKFYKISNLNVTPDAGMDYAGDNVATDGNLANATAGFYEDETVTIKPTDLKYEPKATGENAHPQRLVLSYDLGTVANLETLADNYDDALVAYQDALAEYAAAVRDLKSKDPKGTNALLTDASNTLQQKLDALRSAENDLADAIKLEDTTAKALAKAEEDLTAAQTKQAEAQTAKEDAQAALDAANLVLTQKTNEFNAADTALGKDTDTWSLSNCTVNDNGTPGDDSDDTITADNNSAWAKYKKAKAEREAAEAADANSEAYNAFKAAFDAYVADTNNPAENRTTNGTTPVTLQTVTYNQLDAMNLQLNQGTNEYKYWKLVVAEKRAKENLDEKQAEYDAALAAKNDAQATVDAAQAVLDAADGTLTSDNGSLGKDTDVYNPETGAGDTAWGRRNYANNQHDDAVAALGTNADVYNPDGSTPAEKQDTAYGRRNKAQNDVNDARDAYNTALDNANADKTDLLAAESNLAARKVNLDQARTAYENAAAENDGKLNIYINLSDDVITSQGATPAGDKWQLLPASLVDTDGNGATDTARFYYTSILGGGETTTKLIDSVTLDKDTTQDMFKYFDFDLNVDLKSAQIAMDSDGETILTTAADTTLDAKATLANPTSVDTAITWAAEIPATPTRFTSVGATYKPSSTDAGTNTDVVINTLPAPVKIGTGDTSYKYVIEHNSKKFYGTALTAGTTFVEGTGDTSPFTAGTGTVELNANAVAAPTP